MTQAKQRRDLILHRPERALADELGISLEEVRATLDVHPVGQDRDRYFKHSLAQLRVDNPTQNVERIKTKKGGRRRWSDDELGRYRQHWANGTQQRLCFELALETTARRGNVTMLGPQHERPATDEAPFGWLAVAHIKGSDAALIPISADLRAAINAVRRGT